MYATHFVFNQWIDEILRLLLMTMVFTMGCFIQNQSEYHMAFLISYTILRFFSLFKYIKASLIPRARYHALWHICLYCLILFVLIALIAINNKRWCSFQYFVIYTTLFLTEYGGSFIPTLFSKHSVYC